MITATSAQSNAGPGGFPTSPLTALHRGAHLLEPVLRRASANPGQLVAGYREGDGFVDVTAFELLDRVRALAKGLVGAGIGPGDRVALMCRTRLEWLELDYAILAAGAVTVPVYETSSADQLQWIVADSGAGLVIFETESMRSLLDSAEHAPSGVQSLVIDGGGLDRLVDLGRDVTDEDLDSRVGALSVDDIATIVYTSGTTGRPKGCLLTHGNVRANVLQTLDAVGTTLGPGDRTLLFLPLAHAFSKLVALVASELGAQMMFATSQAALAEELRLARPTMVAAVPRVFEKVFETARRRSEEQGRSRIFDRAAAVAVRYSERRSRHLRPGLLTAVEHSLYERLVYRKVRAAFGGSLRVAFSGASALGERLTHFFDGVGVRVLEGYGLTETSPVITVNSPDAWRPGTVGQPVVGTELQIADDGEILVRGPQVFQGYWHDDDATRTVLSADGWLRTGDIGVLDGGFLRITGRKKDLIVTAGGKNVAPGPLEDRLRAHPLVSHALVIGDGKPFVAALVTIDEEAFALWRADRGDVPPTVSEASHHPELRAAIQQAVDRANELVSRAESIRAFAVLPRDFTVADGELTPTLKVRRAVVETRFAALIASVYGSGPRIA
jgi:long-chain acyl-CoA synthetase